MVHVKSSFANEKSADVCPLVLRSSTLVFKCILVRLCLRYLERCRTSFQYEGSAKTVRYRAEPVKCHLHVPFVFSSQPWRLFRIIADLASIDENVVPQQKPKVQLSENSMASQPAVQCAKFRIRWGPANCVRLLAGVSIIHRT